MAFIRSKRKELITLLICSFLYLLIFTILENTNFKTYFYTETWIDHYIPFIDIFVIPYLLWFVYIVLGFLYFLKEDEQGFYRTCIYIFMGMYICLIIYLIFPNAQGLRVSLDLNQSFQKLLSLVYNVDTSTNVCPSIHVYNSIMMYVSLLKSEKFKQNKLVNTSTCILTILICLSTLFTKQHAFIDALYAIPLCFYVYQFEKNYQMNKYIYTSFICEHIQKFRKERASI